MFATMKNVTVDNDNAELVDFAKSVDFTALFDHIKSFAGIACGFKQPTITTGWVNHSIVSISFTSEDITAQTGSLAAILKQCIICSFNNSVYLDKETGEPAYWVRVHIQYEHKTDGAYGMEMCQAWYKNGAWEFLNTGDSVSQFFILAIRRCCCNEDEFFRKRRARIAGYGDERITEEGISSVASRTYRQSSGCLS